MIRDAFISEGQIYLTGNYNKVTGFIKLRVTIQNPL